MRPAVSVLQLDTRFPRVPGDVACPETYTAEIEIIRIPQASVGEVVTGRPDLVTIAPFEEGLRLAKGEVIVTSCGFLSFWQNHLAALTSRPFVSSALMALENKIDPDSTLTFTFDAHSLTDQHFPGRRTDVVGLRPETHLRQVIEQDQLHLDQARAGTEISTLAKNAVQPHHKTLLLECTNLPPYRSALHRVTGLKIVDILQCIEDIRPGTVRTEIIANTMPA